MTIKGGAPHGGGSCQASLSVDGGRSWKVLKSFIGGCPTPEAQSSSFDFKVPADTPAGGAVFSFTWVPKLAGTNEYYQSCSPITVTGGGGSESVAFRDRPDMFIANVANGCTTVPGVVKYPNPGPDVDVKDPNALPPTGNCGASGNGGGGSSSSGSGGSGLGSSGSSGPGNSGFGSSSGSGPNYKPGNNWPEDFNSAAGAATASVGAMAWWVAVSVLLAALYS
jgi:hypothetical protein